MEHLNSVWKVVRVEADKLVSANMATYQNGFNLNYELGKEVKPYRGKIFCFASLEDAYAWLSKGGWKGIKLCIYRCLAKNAVPAPDEVPCPHWYDLWSVWDEFNELRKYRPYMLKTPKGTLLCDSIELTKKICTVEVEE